MGKDPAFLLYTSDFLTGSMFMSNEEVGIYIRLLCAQHQHGGIIDKSSFNVIVGDHEVVRRKFIEAEDGFFNLRLMEEMKKRQFKSQNLAANALLRWDKAYKSIAKAVPMQSKRIHGAHARHKPIENEDRNENEVNFRDRVKSEERRGRVVSDTFKPTEAMIEWAKKSGVEDPRATTVQFIDHHKARGTVFKDWEAAWRTWMRNDVKFSQQRSRGGNYGPTQGSAFKNPSLDALDEWRRREGIDPDRTEDNGEKI